MRRTFNKRKYTTVLKSGFRSKFEEALAGNLEARGVTFRYEPFKIPYKKPVKRDPTYLPDFVLPNGIIIEAKGYFESEDRTKHKLIQAQYPEFDIRFVFQNSNNKLSKTSKTTYGAWATNNGFKYADTFIPQDWIDETHKSKK